MNERRGVLTEILIIVVGAFILVWAILYENRASSMLVGFGSALSVTGLIRISKYFYWKNPIRKDEYDKKLRYEEINLKDERKAMLRDKSGRVSYLIGLFILATSIIIFMILKALNIFDAGNLFFGFTGMFLFVEYIIGILVFRYLDKRM